MTEASALVDLDRAADGGNPGTGTDADAVSKAKVLMRTALAGKLEEAGAPWQFCDVEVPVVGKLPHRLRRVREDRGPGARQPLVPRERALAVAHRKPIEVQVREQR